MKNRFRTLSPRKWMMIAGSVLLYILMLAALFLLNHSDGRQEKNSVFGSMENRFRSDIVLEHEGSFWYYRENEITNYLIIGLDRESVKDMAGYQNGGQADFMVILCVDRVSRTVTPVMLDRDTMAQVQTCGVFGDPSGTRRMQLCLAQAYSAKGSSGSENTAAAVEALLQGVRMDHYLTLDISAITLLNDAVGGVELTLQDDFSVYDSRMVKGATLRLMGKQAEFFVRGRMTVADGTNVSRMKRQQQYVSAFLTQLRQEMETNPDIMVELLDSVAGHLQSDTSRDILLRDANAYDGYVWNPMRTPEGSHYIDDYRFAEFRLDEDALRDLITQIWFVKEERK